MVGETTATALTDLRRQYSNSPYTPRNILGGGESGTAEKLAHYILKHHSIQDGSHPTFLYLTGDKNRDTLPSILTAGGISLRPLQVYETRGSSTFARDLDEALSKLPSGMIVIDYHVCFSDGRSSVRTTLVDYILCTILSKLCCAVS